MMISLNIFLLILSYSASIFANEYKRPSRGKDEVACEGSSLNIRCEPGSIIDVTRANYGRVSSTVCNDDGQKPIRDLRCLSQNSYEIVNTRCSNQQTCSIQATNSVFGDPCEGTYKYLAVTYNCIAKPTIKRVIACENSNVDIKCQPGYKISIVRANYGRSSRTVCNENGNAPIRTVSCSSKDSNTIVNNYCSGKPSCNIPATNKVFGDPCEGTFKYLEVEYMCKK